MIDEDATDSQLTKKKKKSKRNREEEAEALIESSTQSTNESTNQSTSSSSLDVCSNQSEIQITIEESSIIESRCEIIRSWSSK